MQKPSDIQGENNSKVPHDFFPQKLAQIDVYLLAD